jgi:DNA-binding response OmpR family regulator
VRDGLRRLLQEEGHEVTTAGDGDEGVRVALKDRPEVVLVDIGLPKLDGYGVATRVRKELPEQPLLVAVTGYGSREDRTRALTAGFDLHMTKPVTLDAILDLLARVKPRAPSPPGS